ncbi:MAG TPA: PucR family transcriptional regulator [Candidatus Avanaerovorax faecigallinarum]|nr:PucR family transcriptional regulator [Candidatus Avanaerovorax faecigallinarum]
MNVTVRDCLNLPSLSHAEIIAGKNGLDKVVSSVSVLEFFDFYELDVFTPNEIIISAFYSIKDDVDKQCDALQDLYETGAVALILFYVGKIVQSVEEKLIRLADRLDFPLIVINNEFMSVKYSDVISDVMTSVLKDQSTSDDFITVTSNRLKQLPTELRTMENLLSIMSNHYKCNLLVTGPSKLYFQSVYRPFSMENNPDFYYSCFHNDSAGYCHKEVTLDNSTVYVYKAEFSGEDNIPLTLYACCRNDTLTKDNITDMCECTRLYSTVWGYSLNLNSPDTLLSLVLKTDANAARHYMRNTALDFSRLQSLIIISPGDGEINRLKNSVLNIFEEYKKYCLADIIDGEIVILSNLSRTNEMSENLFNELQSFTVNYDEKATYFMNRSSKDIEAIKQLYYNYRRSLPALRKIFINRRNWDAHDVTLSQEVTSLSETQNQKTEYLNTIIDMLKNDRNNLLKTLGVYLIDCDSELKHTADTMFLHRNTVLYRLARIKQLTNTDFTLMPAAYEFYLAAALHRFESGQ